MRVSDPAVFVELRALAAATTAFEPIELPDVETKLWGGRESHPAWRQGNIPWSTSIAECMYGQVSCEACGARLDTSSGRAIIWASPHETQLTMWETHGMHQECP